MKNARRLLKPGGRLIMVEVTDNDPLRLGLIFAGLPGLWLGEEENRKLSPCVSADEWEIVMKTTGFSGIEAMTPHNRSYPLPLSVIVFRALDDTASQLYAPGITNGASLALNYLTIIGGGSPKSDALARAVEDTVRTHYSTIVRLKSLEEVSHQSLPLLGSILSLVDIEETPLFKDVTSGKLAALRELFKQSKVVLWVSHGPDADTPYRNMYRGLERSIKIEMTHLQSQILDVDSDKDLTPETISERLIKLEAQVALAEAGSLKNFVDYIEPELLIRDSIVHVPRIKRSTQRNRRYNAGRRQILQQVQIDQRRVVITQSGLKNTVSFEHQRKTSLAQPPSTTVELLHSFVRPVQFGPTTALYFSLGRVENTGSIVLALSEDLASTVSTSPQFIIPLAKDTTPQTLFEAYTKLVAVRVLYNAAAGDTVVALDPDRILAAAMTQIANSRWVNIAFITSTRSGEVLSKPWQYLHPLSSPAIAKKALPSAVKLFVHFGRQTSLSSVLQESLPSDALVVHEPWLQVDSATAAKLDPQDSLQVSNILQAVAALPQSNLGLSASHSPAVTTLTDLTSNIVSPDGPAMLAWPNATDSISTTVKPAGNITTFAKDRTYWLVGLTGGLGLSLCEWMAKHGAGHIVLSSRNPKLDPDWLQSMADLGCNIRAFSK